MEVLNTRKGRFTLEGNEAWSSVGSKNNKQWIGLARDRDTGEIDGVEALAGGVEALAGGVEALAGVEASAVGCSTTFDSVPIPPAKASTPVHLLK